MESYGEAQEYLKGAKIKGSIRTSAIGGARIKLEQCVDRNDTISPDIASRSAIVGYSAHYLLYDIKRNFNIQLRWQVLFQHIVTESKLYFISFRPTRF